ncbi:hypothetical protein SDC9_116899 [bioreactor metagenome]|uniref:Uncharacterized protein n=1 Tax=bioreactor metagenome TaxID=1076179 RepID=A0A645BZ52_9ZZZZ
MRITDLSAGGHGDPGTVAVRRHPGNIFGKIGGIGQIRVPAGRTSGHFGKTVFCRRIVRKQFIPGPGIIIGLAGNPGAQIVDVAVQKRRTSGNIETVRNDKIAGRRQPPHLQTVPTAADEAFQKFIHPVQHTARAAPGDDNGVASGGNPPRLFRHRAVGHQSDRMIRHGFGAV